MGRKRECAEGCASRCGLDVMTCPHASHACDCGAGETEAGSLYVVKHKDCPLWIAERAGSMARWGARAEAMVATRAQWDAWLGADRRLLVFEVASPAASAGEEAKRPEGPDAMQAARGAERPWVADAPERQTLQFDPVFGRVVFYDTGRPVDYTRTDLAEQRVREAEFDRARWQDVAESMRSEVARLEAELAERDVRIEKLGEMLDDANACGDACQLGAILCWVEPRDRERIHSMRDTLREKAARAERLEAELAAYDERLTRARNALDAAGIPNVEPYPDEPVDDWERSLRTGGRVVQIHDGIARLAEQLDTARRELEEARAELSRVRAELEPDAGQSLVDVIQARVRQYDEALELTRAQRAEIERLRAREAQVRSELSHRYAPATTVERIRKLIESGEGRKG